jgi:hypothetical protein
MSDPAFTRGVADYRAGRPPNYDAFNFTQGTNDASAASLINAHWIMSEVGTGQRSHLPSAFAGLLSYCSLSGVLTERKGEFQSD